MNDRYLYRAKRKKWELFPKAQQWVQGYYVHTAESDYIVSPYEHTTLLGEGETVEIEVNTLCQCTGLKDKNGKLIWENDIVNCFEAECCGKISWNESEAGFYFDVLLEDGTCEEEHIYDYADCMDVIGNIFDNPELLEVGE